MLETKEDAKRLVKATETWLGKLYDDFSVRAIYPFLSAFDRLIVRTGPMKTGYDYYAITKCSKLVESENPFDGFRYAFLSKQTLEELAVIKPRLSPQDLNILKLIFGDRVRDAERKYEYAANKLQELRQELESIKQHYEVAVKNENSSSKVFKQD